MDYERVDVLKEVEIVSMEYNLWYGKVLRKLWSVVVFWQQEEKREILQEEVEMEKVVELQQGGVLALRFIKYCFVFRIFISFSFL